jgi:hypothetical protein
LGRGEAFVEFEVPNECDYPKAITFRKEI